MPDEVTPTSVATPAPPVATAPTPAPATEPAAPAVPAPAAPPPDPLQALRDEIAAARANAQRPAAQPQHAAPQPTAPAAHGAPPQVDVQALNQRFWQNPMEMMAAASNATQQQIMGQLAPTLAAQAKAAVRSESGNTAVFDVLNDEIEAAMAQVDPVLRTQPDTWRNAFYLARGKYHDRLASMPRPAANAVVSGSGPAAASVAASPAPPAVQLNAQQARIAGAFEMSADEYNEFSSGVNDDGIFILSHTRK